MAWVSTRAFSIFGQTIRMKTFLTILLIAYTNLSVAQTRGAVKEDWAIYGPSQSLIGIAKGWAPTYFYPLDTSFRKYILKYDRFILESPYHLDSFLKERKFVWVRHSDTMYLPYKLPKQ